MSDDIKKRLEIARRLLDLANDSPLSGSEAREELASQGVDVDASVRAAMDAVRAAKKKARLGWQEDAREKARQFGSRHTASAYAHLAHDKLMSMARERGLAANHKNFQALTDDDLRTLLADADDLEDDGGEAK